MSFKKDGNDNHKTALLIIFKVSVVSKVSIVSIVGASHFGNKDWAEKYYGVVIRLVEAGKRARVKWNEHVTLEHDLVLEKEVPKKEKVWVTNTTSKSWMDKWLPTWSNIYSRCYLSSGNFAFR